MHKNPLFKLLLTGVLTLWLAASNLALGQGSTTSGISGFVNDTQGHPVSGVTVTITHVPTGTRSVTGTRANGQFSQSGLRVGGPYTVTATAPGYKFDSITEIQTGLGETTSVTLVAKGEDVVTLEAVSVTASTSDLDGNNTGAGSVLGNRGVSNMPTSNRSFADMIKTNPFVTVRAFPQITALGMNNRYNSITLDGARLNDQFGLAGSGLFSLKNPFSLDAVEQVSVSLTPYDVTQSGFAGASINVVSKSGTNEFHGSAYYLYTSEHWQGKDVSGTNAGKRPATFYERTWGATLGGPIIKDKLFFFVNYEKFNNPGSGPSNAGFTPDGNALTVINNQISALPGNPALGSFGAAAPNLLSDEKKMAKIDWNITNDHRLSVRYSTTEGAQPFSPNFRATGLSTPFPTLSPTPTYGNGITSYDSNYYSLAVNEKVWAGQLFSNWTPDLKTEFNYAKNNTTSLRSTPTIFPEIVILNVPTTTGLSTNNALLLGTDVSSMGNGVISDSISYGGNATYTMGDYTFKAGFDREETDFENLFRNGSYGVFVYNYSPTLNLTTDVPRGFIRGVASEGFPGTDISRLEQTGYFVQTKWAPSSRFNLTGGLRYDVMGSPIAPPNNAAFAAAFGVRNDGTIDGTNQLAPRVSFNYAVDKDRAIQVRGGLGVFLGRNPWVWISNSYGNAGYGRFQVSSGTPTLGQYLTGTYPGGDAAFKFDPANPLGTSSLSAATSVSDVNFLVSGLKLPTNLRGNLAVDVKVPKLDANFTVEYIHTDIMKAMFYDNINLVKDGSGADGRTYFRRAATTSAGALITYVPVGSTVTSTSITTPGGTVIALPSGNRVTPNTYNLNFARAIRLSNVDVGSSDYVAFSLDRPFKNGWAYNLTYTLGQAKEAQPAGSSTAGSQWGFNIVFNQGQIENVRSDYEIKNRLQASISKEFNFLQRYKTTATLYYEGRSGQPYSYVYSGDLNFDGNVANDVVAVPLNASDPRFNFASMTAAQQAAYFAFIKESGLDDYAGGYAPRNAFVGPWQNRLDLHLSQEVKVTGPVRVELFADFINFGNWLNKGLFNYVETINNTTSNSNQNRQLGNASYGSDGRIIPTATIDSAGALVIPPTSQILPNNGDARWRIVAGVRLKF